MVTLTEPVTAETPTAYDTAASMMGGAGDIYKGLGQGAGSLTNVNSYLNPYLDNVLDAALGRMQTNYERTMGSIGDAAIRSGAFGGSRQGVAEGIATGEYNRNVGEITADTQARGFESAADRLYRDMMASAQGQTQLGSAYYNIGTDITDRQMGQGTMQQQLLQAILGEGSGMFDEMMQDPYDAITMMQALLSSDARRGNVTGSQSTTPSIFDYLAAAAGMFKVSM